jgi:hypothetical protein
MNRRAEVGAKALTDHADRPIRRARIRRRCIKRRPRLVLRDLGRALQGLGRAIQMPRSIAADVDLDAQGLGRRR